LFVVLFCLFIVAIMVVVLFLGRDWFVGLAWLGLAWLGLACLGTALSPRIVFTMAITKNIFCVVKNPTSNALFHSCRASLERSLQLFFHVSRSAHS
jgi:hypothetical protein